MNSIELFRQLQGELNQGEYAELLGISRPFINLILNGRREPGMLALRGLLRAFPERESEIIAALRGNGEQADA